MCKPEVTPGIVLQELSSPWDLGLWDDVMLTGQPAPEVMPGFPGGSEDQILQQRFPAYVLTQAPVLPSEAISV